MKFDPKLPLNIRIKKRRKQKRIRALTLFAVFAVISMIAVTGWYDGIISSGQGSTLTPSSNEGNAKRATTQGAKYIEESADTGIISGFNEDVSSIEYTGGDTGEDKKNTVTRDYSALKDELERYIKKFKGQYGLYYINLVNGEEFGINDREVYVAASTVKIPINQYLYKRIKERSVNPDATMTYLEEDYEGGTGSLQYEKVGSRYTVRELSRLSIEVSDNIATNMLLRLLRRKNVKDYMRKLGGVVVDDDDNVSCPRDMALYMKKVYEFYKSDNSLGKELMGYFENTVFKERIPKLLPKGVRVAHKIGNQAGAYHDVGIVFADEPYIVSVMSKDIDDEEEAYSVIANISKKIYDFSRKK